MLGFIRRVLLFGFVLLFSATSYGFIHESVRIRSLGTDFAGLIEDPYTNVFRNPAYLAKWEKGALTAEVLDAEKSVFAANLAFPSKFINLGISYKAFGHPDEFTSADGRNFSGQRVASDLYGIPDGLSGLKKFQTVKGIGAKSVGPVDVGMDIQYLRDWTAGGSGFSAPSYNQLPTALQVRAGGVFSPLSKWNVDVTLRYQRNRPRLEAGSRISYNAWESDTSNYNNPNYPYVFFGNNPLALYNASTRMNEWGIFMSSRVSFPRDLQFGIVISAERIKGDLPVIMGVSDDVYELYGPDIYRRTVSALTDSLIQHFSWKYRTGFSFSKSLRNRGLSCGGAVITVIRTREFYLVTYDSSVSFQKNGNTLRSKTGLASRSGEMNKRYFTELAIPTAVELKPRENIGVRVGIRPMLIIDNPDFGGHSADLNTFYSLGFGMTFEEHIQIETFSEEDLGNLQNWQIALRYVF
ncbi:MAG: hypothetical protein ACM3YF_02830 [Candidatus Zixiibacteriota bacterium]